MSYCRRCNRYHSSQRCLRCEERVVRQATRLPLRVTAPQAWPRCHRCWNLLPHCHCDGWLGTLVTLPALSGAL